MARLSRLSLAAAAALSLGLGMAAPAAVAAPQSAPAAAAQAAKAPEKAKHAFEFGVIGDVPYGAQQVADFPHMIDELSAQRKDLEFVAHVGDVKAGSAVCSDEYFQMIRSEFDRLALPLVLTPGDNDWSDCHRANNGAYNPLERLDAFREVFYPVADRTLGDTSMTLDAQDELGLPENARFREQRVEFAVLNIQGSSNSTLPWSGLGLTEQTPEQIAEVAHRDAANAQLIRDAFADAEKTNARGVVLLTQADMFEPGMVEDGVVPATTAAQYQAFRPTIQLIAELSRESGKPVYLINGDSHVYTADAPLAAGSPWLDVYGVAPVENFQRVTVEGSATSKEWTRFSVAPNSAGRGAHADQPLLTWERVPYTTF
ncbi:hypothetical protein [Micrococcus porci]|uniref:hypothetical protein n=1 Tax=Micrococcus porci TaxID=2856555 RepID=UPI003CED2CDE